MNRKKLMDFFGLFLSWLASTITITVCIGIVAYLFVKGYRQINLDFILQQPNPTFNEALSGGISTPIIGTFILTFIGILLAFPWALATAIYLSEYAKKNALTNYFKMAIDVLAGIPTIVIAIFGLAVFTNPVMGILSSKVEGVEGINRAYGRSFIVCGITMAIMILPFIIKACEEALKSVPDSYREGSLAMGASKWHTIIKIVIPAARNGLLTGVILGMGRIIGDTAIVWLTLGGTMRMTGIQPWWRPTNLLSTLTNTGSTLTSYIYYASPAGEGNMTEKAFGACFVLVLIIILLNFITDLISRNKKFVKE